MPRGHVKARAEELCGVVPSSHLYLVLGMKSGQQACAASLASRAISSLPTLTLTTQADSVELQPDPPASASAGFPPELQCREGGMELY